MDATELLAAHAREQIAAGQLAEGIEAWEQVVEQAPHRADWLVEFGLLWQALAEPAPAAECYRRAVAADPTYVPARQSWGYLLAHCGEPDQALEQYQHAVRLSGSPLSHLLAATVLPVVYGSHAELQFWRDRLRHELRRLVESGVRVPTARSLLPTTFYWAYQGENDRELAADFGAICIPDNRCLPLELTPPTPRIGPLRVGFLSAFFRDHTIGRLHLGLVRHLPRDRYRVSVLAANSEQDPWSQEFAASADEWVQIPREIAAAREVIAHQRLDVLIHADVGMDSLTSTLAHSRLAPTQCATWGHPDTTGSQAIDYFVSSELLEPEDAASHYTESLVRLPGLGLYYERPARTGPPRDRSNWGFHAGQHLYACLQTPYKFHPAFDEALAGILRHDPAAVLVLLAGRVPNWTERLQRRFRETLPEQGARVHFLPAQEWDDYLALLQAADVVLDPFPFGGGNSSLEALAMGTPVVTRAGRFLRGRITAALYARLAWTALVSSAISEYIATAVRLGSDRDFNQECRRRLTADAPALFADGQAIEAWDQFLHSLPRPAISPASVL